VTNVAVLFVGIIHVGFFILERMMWLTPTGAKIFKITPEVARASAVLAANQGVYNLILALGLFWTVGASHVSWFNPVRIFILLMIMAVGIYGTFTFSKITLFVQFVPALVALVLCLAELAQPRINDITTSFRDPPRFDKIGEMNSSRNYTYPEEYSKLQREFYSEVLPLELLNSRNQVFEVVSEIAGSQWEVVDVNPHEFRVEAKDVTQFFRWVDDVSIEVRERGLGGSVVHMRSKSRKGKSDFGANAQRIVQFLREVRARLESLN